MSDIRRMENQSVGSDAEQTGSSRNRFRSLAGPAKDQAAHEFGTFQSRLGNGWMRTRQQASTHPFLTVAGAAAVGAGLGLLLPAGRREKQVMADVAQKVGDVAREAADTAVEVGREQVDDLAQKALASVGEAVVQAVVASGKPESQAGPQSSGS